MTTLARVAVAGDVTEAELIQEVLAAAGIESHLEIATEHDPEALDDPPLEVLVPESWVENAGDAIEGFEEADDEDGAG